MRLASRASTMRPDRHSSAPMALPTRRGKRCVPPPPGMMPMATSGWPRWARSEPMRIVRQRDGDMTPDIGKEHSVAKAKAALAG